MKHKIIKIQVYLAFNGNCQEALNFYANLFDADVNNRQAYEDKNIEVPSSFGQRLQHAEVKGNGVHFMAYDAALDTPLNNGNQINMSADINDLEEENSYLRIC